MQARNKKWGKGCDGKKAGNTIINKIEILKWFFFSDVFKNKM